MRINPVQTQLSTRQKIVASTVSAAAVAGGLVYMAKTGKLDAKVGGNLIAETAKTALRKPANFLAKQADIVMAGATAFIEKHPKIDNAISNASEKAANAKDFVSGKFNAAKDFAGDKLASLRAKLPGGQAKEMNVVAEA